MEKLLNIAIIAAGGKGTRFGGDVPKQFAEHDGRPVIAYTLEKFRECRSVDGIVAVVPEEWKGFCAEATDKYGISKISGIAAGGGGRQQSVYNGLKFIREKYGDDVGIVAVHDAARPFVTPEDIDRVVGLAEERGAAMLAVPARDTVKIVSGGGKMTTPDRNTVYLAQTPQAFRFGIIMDAYEKAERDGFVGTDDCSLVERLGIWPGVVVGSYGNVKITERKDMLLFVNSYC